ncbi:hypothetical protein J4H70_17795 [Vibrio alginolyticus]|uniref:zinc-finger-containing protein n=2 Tax=Vibrio harveyi group TaxID=717610 RepID=UPI001BD1D252|nr:zinc-finger-containing protein [Vibrio alginolyticus]MBS9810628.1 hypothetical protein [Vibrio alginolyticus]
MNAYRREPPYGRIVVDCPYCGSEARLVKGDVIYPHRKDLAKKNFYLCENGHERAYVGCHGYSIVPLGRLADSKLRADKSAAHAAFDPIWKNGSMKRGEAYKWLADKLGIDKESCHIGLFDRVTCRKVIRIMGEHYDSLDSKH